MCRALRYGIYNATLTNLRCSETHFKYCILKVNLLIYSYISMSHHYTKHDVQNVIVFHDYVLTKTG